MRDIGKNIRELRNRNLMTQDALAEALFVTRQTVSNYETGRSRPDIDMLMKMAEVLKTDVNSILYGLPDGQCRRKEFKRFLLGLLGCLISGLPILLLWNRVREAWMHHYIAGPRLFLEWLLLPLFLLFLGWTLMQGLGLLMKTNAPRLRWSRALGAAVLLGILFYFALTLPSVIHGIKSLLVHGYVKGLDSQLMSMHSSFSLWPDWLNRLSGPYLFFFYQRQWLFFAAGLLFWLFGELEKHKLRKLLLSVLFALGIGFCLYLCADSTFILEVADPDELGHVPYHIQVEHYTDIN